MASQILTFCLSKPYQWDILTRENVRIFVKKTALVFALETGADITIAINSVDEVTDRIMKEGNHENH